MFKKKRIIQTLTLAVALAASYVGVCAYHLESLSSEHLLQMRLLVYGSDREPVGLPMPSLFKDLFWEVRGRGKVILASETDPSIATHAVELVDYFAYIGEPVDPERTAQLLVDLRIEK